MFYEQKKSDLYFAHKYDGNPAGCIDPYHFHAEYEMILFVRGSAEYTVESKKYKLTPGDIVFTAPGQHHYINVSADCPYERYVIRFSERNLPRNLIAALKHGCYSTKDTAIVALFMSLDGHIENYHGECSYELLKCELLQILYYFCSECKPCGYEIENQRVYKTIEYISNNISTDFTLVDICKDLRCSESYIRQEFHENMNTTVISYVRQKRIFLAQSLINQGAKTKDIYKKCGFDDYSTFFRTYKKVLGHTPSLKTRNSS